jgi:hypothetical protein
VVTCLQDEDIETEPFAINANLSRLAVRQQNETYYL